MFEPIFHKFVTARGAPSTSGARRERAPSVSGSAAVLVALSTIRIADSIEVFLLNTNERLKHLEENSNRVTESIERGMMKYAPPKK